MAESVIRLTNIEKSYGKKKVLTNVTLDVHKGDIYGLVGKNGAGKSTLFKVILGLSEYQGGTLELEGSTDNIDKARTHFGFFVGSNLFSYMTAKENLMYYAKLKNVKNREEEVERVLKLVDMAGVGTKVGGFSLGMRQRIGIANALLGNPDVVILDEPTNGLDPQGIIDIRNTVKKINEEYGTTFIISSHILGELQNTATRFGLLNNGVVVKEISQDDLMQSDNIVRLSVDDLEKAKEVLLREGISILAEERETKSLEDYYFSLIGGGDHNA